LGLRAGRIGRHRSGGLRDKHLCPLTCPKQTVMTVGFGRWLAVGLDPVEQVAR